MRRTGKRLLAVMPFVKGGWQISIDQNGREERTFDTAKRRRETTTHCMWDGTAA